MPSAPLLFLCHALPLLLSCCSSSARLGHNRMLYLNTRVYSLYWDISLLCLSRASVEQLTARSLRARTVHIYRFDFPPPRSTSDAKRSCPFPSSAIKTAVSSTSHLLFQHRFAIFVPRVRLSPKSRMSFCKFTELLATDSPYGVDTVVPFSQTAAGKYRLTTHFIDFARGCSIASQK